MSFKGQCSGCGWGTQRKLENMGRKCPKCGGSIYVHQEDRADAMVYAIVCIIGMILVGLLFVATGAAKL